MKEKKVVFMGTPEFSVPILKELIKHTNVIAVVTQPDKEVGRKKIVSFSPVKQVALENNILVLQPKKVRKEYQMINDLNPDVIVTCAYGQILPLELLAYPKYKTINVHASLLPKYRGGAPIHHAIKNGDLKTGITIMRTDVGMDSGDIINKAEIDILNDDTYDSLALKLSNLGAGLLIETLPKIFDGTCEYIKQNEDEVSLAYTIKREEEHLDFNNLAHDIYNHVRAFNSIPSTYTIFDDKELKVYACVVGEDTLDIPGTIVSASKKGIGVATKDKIIYLTDIKLDGKKRMDAASFINGIRKENLIGKKLL